MPQNLDVTRHTLEYVMCDSEELFGPLEGHNKIQQMKNELSFLF